MNLIKHGVKVFDHRNEVTDIFSGCCYGFEALITRGYDGLADLKDGDDACGSTETIHFDDERPFDVTELKRPNFRMERGRRMLRSNRAVGRLYSVPRQEVT